MTTTTFDPLSDFRLIYTGATDDEEGWRFSASIGGVGSAVRLSKRKIDSPVACASLCLTNSKCVAFSSFQPRNKKRPRFCVLMSSLSAGKRTSMEGVHYALEELTAPERILKAPAALRSTVTLTFDTFSSSEAKERRRFSTAFTSAVRLFSANTIDTCINSCNVNPLCKGVFSFITKSGAQNCYGLGDLGRTKGTETSVESYSYTKVFDTPVAPGEKFVLKYDGELDRKRFSTSWASSGKRLFVVQTSVDDCKAECLSRDQCKGVFTWQASGGFKCAGLSDLGTVASTSSPSQSWERSG